MSLTSGQIVDEKFEVLAEVGHGGMGTVYRAQHLQLHKLVALKVLNAQLAIEPEKVLRFRREAQLVNILEHPNIVQIFAVGVVDSSTPYIAMEYLEGVQLNQVLEQDGPMPWRKLLPLLIEVADALQYAHEKEIVHRDIKPSNIMLVSDAQGTQHVKLVDFGIARSVAESAPKLTQTNMLVGSVFYMSPSDLSGAKPSPASDIYSLGCTMFEMLAGQPPFAGDTVFDTMDKHSNAPVPSVNAVNPKADVPADLQRLIDWMMAKEPERRAPSAIAVKEAMGAVLAGEPIKISAVRHSSPRPRLDGRLVWLLALMLIATVSSYFVLNSKYHAPERAHLNLLTEDSDPPTEEARMISELERIGANPERYERMGNAYKFKRLYLPALMVYEQGLALGPSEERKADIMCSRGQAAQALGLNDLAEESFLASYNTNARLKKRTYIHQAGLLRVYAEQGKTEQARKWQQFVYDSIQRNHQLVGLPVENSIFLGAVCETRLRMGDYKGALEVARYLENYAGEHKLETPSAQALRLVAQSYMGRRITLAQVEKVKHLARFDATTYPSHVMLVLAWAVAKDDPDAASKLALEGMRGALDNGFSHDKLKYDDYLKIFYLEDALRLSAYCQLRMNGAPKEAIEALRPALLQQRAAAGARATDRSNVQLPIDFKSIKVLQ